MSSGADQPAELTVGLSLLTQGAHQFTGTASYVRGLLREFAREPLGVGVHALCNEHALRAFGGCARGNVRVTPATGLRVGTSRARRAATLARALVRPATVSRQFSPSVSVVHYPLTLGVPWTALPTVLSLHDVQHHDMPQHFSMVARLTRQILYDAPARRATLLVTLSEHSKERIVATLEIDPARVTVIPLAADHDRFRPHPDPREEELVAALCLPKRFLFYPATLWPHKNHLRLLDAFARVKDPQLHLLLCGAPFGRLEEIRAAAARHGIADRVRHLGFVADDVLPAIYRRATALVFPTTYEGFGAPTLEAMASGCPVASSLSGPLAEICAGAAEVLEPQDPAQMAAAISAVTTDEELRSRLRQAGIERAAQFSWARSARAHADVYRRARDVGG